MLMRQQVNNGVSKDSLLFYFFLKPLKRRLAGYYMMAENEKSMMRLLKLPNLKKIKVHLCVGWQNLPIQHLSLSTDFENLR